MSQPAVAALAPLPFELVYGDGEPLESNWHRIQMSLFINVTRQAMTERGRTDFFVGANMFVYYSYEQARDIAADPVGSKQFRGPDIFFVGDVPVRHDRQVWVVWEEGDRYPDLIIELLSPSTMKKDRTVKKDLYARTFRTAEYYLYRIEPRNWRVSGWWAARTSRGSPTQRGGSGARRSAWTLGFGRAGSRIRTPPGFVCSIARAG